MEELESLIIYHKLHLLDPRRDAARLGPGEDGPVTKQTTIRDEAGGAAGPDAGELHVLVMSPDSFVSLPLPPSGTLEVGRSSKCPIRLDDPLASRQHARLHVTPAENGLLLEVEDLESANGTRVRDQRIEPGRRTPFLAGEAITVGSTVLMVQRNRPAVGLRRLWSHGYFETRLDDECTRAAGGTSTFALARIHVGVTPWTRVVPSLVRHIPAPHLFAAYGPRDYEILFLECKPDDVTTLMTALAADLLGEEIQAHHAVAWYPGDGRSADAMLARANALLRRPTSPPETTTSDGGGNETDGAVMERIRDLARRAAASSINVLILGETGVGKDVLARTIHRLSGRRGAFVALNCGGLAPSLIESELFGHERGAFTGAAGSKVGLLESGNGGTVFLDEIGEMPAAQQAKLLRAIETREVLPVGGVKPRAIDVRFVAATNRDLEEEASEGRFRQDLFFRLNGITLAIPPLRERTSEIAPLAETFIRQACTEGKRSPPTFSPAAMEHLLRYAWPGNIRELKNVIERALVLSDGPEIWPEHLPLDKMKTMPRVTNEDTPGRPVQGSSAVLEGSGFSGRGARRPAVLDELERQTERQRIVDALAANAGNQTRAAVSLGMPRRTFVSKLEAYGIPRPQKNGSPGKPSADAPPDETT
jgi:two-component system, NtrC family, response regulator AtoC